MATAPWLSDQLSSEEIAVLMQSEVISVFVFYLKNVFKNTFFNLEKSKEFIFTTQSATFVTWINNNQSKMVLQWFPTFFGSDIFYATFYLKKNNN